MNFDPNYRNTDEPVESVEFQNNGDKFRCNDGIISKGGEDYDKVQVNCTKCTHSDLIFCVQFMEKFKTVFAYKSQQNYHQINFMVIGPIAQKKHAATGRWVGTWQDADT